MNPDRREGSPREEWEKAYLLQRYSPLRGAYHYYDNIGLGRPHYSLPMIENLRGKKSDAFIAKVSFNRNNMTVDIIGKLHVFDHIPEWDTFVTMTDPSLIASILRRIYDSHGSSRSGAKGGEREYLALVVGNNLDKLTVISYKYKKYRKILLKYLYIYLYVNDNCNDYREIPSRIMLGEGVGYWDSKDITIVMLCLGCGCPVSSDGEFNIKIINKNNRIDISVDKYSIYDGYFAWIDRYHKEKIYFRAYPLTIPVVVGSKNEVANGEVVDNYIGSLHEFVIASIVNVTNKYKPWKTSVLAPSSSFIRSYHTMVSNNFDSDDSTIDLYGYPTSSLDRVQLIDFRIELTDYYINKIHKYYRDYVIKRLISILMNNDDGDKTYRNIDIFIDPRATLKAIAFSPLYWLIIDRLCDKKKRKTPGSALWTMSIVRIYSLVANLIPALGESSDDVRITIFRNYKDDVLVDIVRIAVNILREVSGRKRLDLIDFHAAVLLATLSRAGCLDNKDILIKKLKDIRKVNAISHAIASSLFMSGIHGLSHVLGETLSEEFGLDIVRENVISAVPEALGKKLIRKDNINIMNSVILIDGTLALQVKGEDQLGRARIILVSDSHMKKSIDRRVLSSACNKIKELVDNNHFNMNSDKQLYSRIITDVRKYLDKMSLTKCRKVNGKQIGDIVKSIVENLYFEDNIDGKQVVLAPTLSGSRHYIMDELKERIKEIEGDKSENCIREVRSVVRPILDTLIFAHIPSCFDACPKCVANNFYCSLPSKWTIESVTSLSAANVICSGLLEKGVVR